MDKLVVIAGLILAILVLICFVVFAVAEYRRIKCLGEVMKVCHKILD